MKMKGIIFIIGIWIYLFSFAYLFSYIINEVVRPSEYIIENYQQDYYFTITAMILWVVLVGIQAQGIIWIGRKLKIIPIRRRIF